MQPAFTFSMLITIEPMLSVEGRHHLLDLRTKLVNRARKRTKCWPTLEEAIQDYNDPRRRGAKWDARVLNLFVVRHHLFRAVGLLLNYVPAAAAWFVLECTHLELQVVLHA
jgi:hypothetical protein